MTGITKEVYYEAMLKYQYKHNMHNYVVTILICWLPCSISNLHVHDEQQNT